jgi:hypothetical protein
MTMSPRLTNALSSGSPMTTQELQLARAFYQNLAAAMVAGGPLFSVSHRVAMQLHDQADARLNASLEQNQALRRAQDRAREQEEAQRLPIEQ